MSEKQPRWWARQDSNCLAQQVNFTPEYQHLYQQRPLRLLFRNAGSVLRPALRHEPTSDLARKRTPVDGGPPSPRGMVAQRVVRPVSADPVTGDLGGLLGRTGLHARALVHIEGEGPSAALDMDHRGKGGRRPP